MDEAKLTEIVCKKCVHGKSFTCMKGHEDLIQSKPMPCEALKVLLELTQDDETKTFIEWFLKFGYSGAKP